VRSNNRGLDLVRSYLADSLSVQREMADTCLPEILRASEILAGAIRAGHKILLCGNGGSAADCQHVAAELVSQLSRDRSRPPVAAIALTTDTSLLTAYANDFGFAGVFERQVRALGGKGDVLIAISTSGQSENVRRAVVAAKSGGMSTIGLGGSGWSLSPEVDLAVIVPGANTQHIQEALLPVEHVICLLTEYDLFGWPQSGDGK
jgi:phosphoheptose isomerase